MKAIVCILAVLALAGGCSRFDMSSKEAPRATSRSAPTTSSPTSTPAVPPTPPPEKPMETSLANPASTHCTEIGGSSEILTNVNGDSYGLCRLPDGRECEEWTLFREGRCVPQ